MKDRAKLFSQGIHVVNVLCFFLVSFSSAGCATTWKETGSFLRVVQTTVQVDSKPSGNVKIDNRYVGDTPVAVPLQYKQKVMKSSRKVNYWITQPGFATFLTIVSLGFYLPFSLLPVDQQSKLDPLENFEGNDFELKISASGYREWSELISLHGEPQKHVQVQLQEQPVGR